MIKGVLRCNKRGINVLIQVKMNEIFEFLLAKDNFMPEDLRYLGQPTALGKPGFTYCAREPLTRNKGRVQNFKETGDSRYIYLGEIDKVCFEHDMAKGNFNDLPKKSCFSQGITW